MSASTGVLMALRNAAVVLSVMAFMFWLGVDYQRDRQFNAGHKIEKRPRWIEVSRKFTPPAPHVRHIDVDGGDEFDRIIHGFTVVEYRHRRTGLPRRDVVLGDAR